MAKESLIGTKIAPATAMKGAIADLSGRKLGPNLGGNASFAFVDDLDTGDASPKAHHIIGRRAPLMLKMVDIARLTDNKMVAMKAVADLQFGVDRIHDAEEAVPVVLDDDSPIGIPLHNEHDACREIGGDDGIGQDHMRGTIVFHTADIRQEGKIIGLSAEPRKNIECRYTGRIIGTYLAP